MNIESWERNYRNSSSQIFFKIGCSRKFHMKTPVLFLIKLQIWRLASSLRRDSKTRVMRKKLQKQSFADILQERFSYKFRNFHRKIPVLESLFNKVARLKTCNFIKKRPQHRCFLVKLAKFLRTPLLQNTSGGYFWN